MSKQAMAFDGKTTFASGKWARTCKLMIEPNSICIEFLKMKERMMFDMIRACVASVAESASYLLIVLEVYGGT